MAESSLVVHLRPVASEQEQAALDAALDTLIGMALRNIADKRAYNEAVQRGMVEISITPRTQRKLEQSS
jgi:hypothetical protein